MRIVGLLEIAAAVSCRRARRGSIGKLERGGAIGDGIVVSEQVREGDDAAVDRHGAKRRHRVDAETGANDCLVVVERTVGETHARIEIAPIPIPQALRNPSLARRFDVRTRQLVQVAENALRYFEECNVAAGMDQVTELVKASHQVRRSRLDSYRVIIQGLQLSVACMFVLAAVFSFT